MTTCPPKLSIIIPVLNEAKSIKLLLPRLQSILNTITPTWEVVIVDDGGNDDLALVCQEFINTTATNLRLIVLSRNFGKEAAMSAGFSAARGDAVICIDGDGQHPPELIPEMVRLWQQGNDMVVGVISNRKHESRVIGSIKKSFYKFLRGSDRFEITENAGDFRLMNRKVIQSLLALPERVRYMKGLYAWVGFKTAVLPFEVAERFAGDSKFNFGQLFELAVIGITSFSMKPLRLVSRTGMIISLLSIIYGLYIIVNYFVSGVEVAGWATLAAGLTLLSGIQLICLGLIGEYLGRLFDEVKQRPLYIVAQDLDFSDLPAQPALSPDSGLWLNSANV